MRWYILCFGILFVRRLLPYLFTLFGRVVGKSVQSRTQHRREILLERAAIEEAEQKRQKISSGQKTSSSTSLDDDWEKVHSGAKTPVKSSTSHADEVYDGIIGFFHPFCNAGGGGERVLFAAIHATQQRYPKALCVVYTGDHEVSKEQILTNVHNRFNIDLNAPRISFMYLNTREWVLASRWPHFTLIGQSLGSLVLGWDAFNLVVPDVLIDTIGYAFVLGLCKWLFPDVSTGAYVHYPTISTDMLDSLGDEVGGRGLNAGSGKGWKGMAKLYYWKLFAWLYARVGGSVDVVMTNSSWTQAHMTSLWGPVRSKQKKRHPIQIMYPPCAVEDLHEKIPVDRESEKQRTKTIIYISQFRPEKVHHVVISAFATYLKSLRPNDPRPKLILAGSVRDDQDEKLVYKLRLQAQEIRDHVEFVVNSKWSHLLELLRTSSIGANGMWNEHFGIGVVEYQAAGLISVVNNSGGPKEDIVVDVDGKPTGYHASTIQEYADGFATALNLSPEETFEMRQRARKNSLRFSEHVFNIAWTQQLEHLVKMTRR